MRRVQKVEMFVVHALKIIFIAVPGTGTNSFQEAMDQVYGIETYHAEANHPSWEIHPEITWDAHFTAEQVRMCIDPKLWNSYQKVSFLREPYEWTKSLYRKPGAWLTIGIEQDGTYIEFLRKLKKTPYFWFTNSKGNVLVDMIYKTEDLRKIFSKYKLSYRHINKGIDPGREAKYTPEVESILREKFHREYKHYNEWLV